MLRTNGKNKVNRVLRRGIKVRASNDADLKWIWAAYRKGGFPDFDANMTVEEFKLHLFRELANKQDVITAEIDGKPIGLIFLFEDTIDLVEPHAMWFPWASSRNKLEATIKMFDQIRRTPAMSDRHKREFKMVYATVPTTEVKDFLTHVAKYGILRRVGTLKDYISKGKDAAIFQSRGV